MLVSILSLRSLMLNSFCKTLIFEDIDCSIAHVKMLSKTKVLSTSESIKIIEGLKSIKQTLLMVPS